MTPLNSILNNSKIVYSRNAKIYKNNEIELISAGKHKEADLLKASNDENLKLLKTI